MICIGFNGTGLAIGCSLAVSGILSINSIAENPFSFSSAPLASCSASFAAAALSPKTSARRVAASGRVMINLGDLFLRSNIIRSILVANSGSLFCLAKKYPKPSSKPVVSSMVKIRSLYRLNSFITKNSVAVIYPGCRKFPKPAPNRRLWTADSRWPALCPYRTCFRILFLFRLLCHFSAHCRIRLHCVQTHFQ